MRFFLIIVLFIPFSLLAQTGNLTVFSEQLPFKLYINEIQQNQKSGTHLRISEIPSAYINLKIVFEDPALPAITKKNVGLADVDNLMLDVIYRLKKEKDGKIKFQFYGNAPAGRSKPDSITEVIKYKTITETPASEKTALTMIADPGSKKPTDNTIKVVSQQSPVIDQKNKNLPAAKTEIKNQTTKPVIQKAEVKPVAHLQAPIKKCTGWPVAKDDFDKAKAVVLAANSEDLKLKEAKTLAAANCLMVSQVSELTELLQSENAKFSFIKFAYAFTIDRQNYNKLKLSLKEVKNQSAVDDLIKLR